MLSVIVLVKKTYFSGVMMLSVFVLVKNTYLGIPYDEIHRLEILYNIKS